MTKAATFPPSPSLVETCLPERASLAQEVPALVERDLELLQLPTIGVVGRPGGLALPERVLLRDELLDRSVYLLIVHHPSSSGRHRSARGHRNRRITPKTSSAETCATCRDPAGCTVGR